MDSSTTEYGDAFSDPSWGLIDANDWSVELNMGRAEECDGFVFHVRGGEDAVGVVAAILQQLDLRALDSQTGEFFVAGPRGHRPALRSCRA